MNGPHVFIVAVENSADHLGASLIDALKQASPDINISAVGGTAIAGHGIASLVNTDGLSILGISEGIRAYPLVLKRVKQTVAAIMRESPDAVILIDSWGFMIRVSQRLKKAGFKGKVIKYLPPQVWAMRAGRAKVLAKSNDHVLSIHSFEAPYFERHGLSVTHVGNPMFDMDFSTGNGAAIRQEFGIKDEQRICAVLFGSRPSEFNQLRKPILSSIALLKECYPDLVFVSPVSNTLRGQIMQEANESSMRQLHLLAEARKFDVFAAADVAIACSGTVTTQLASVGIPSVVIYKFKAASWWIIKRLYKPKFASLVNISADKALMTELLQGQARGALIANEIGVLLNDQALMEKRSHELMTEANNMRGNGGSASESAADKILSLIAG